MCTSELIIYNLVKEMIYFLKYDFNTCQSLCPSEGGGIITAFQNRKGKIEDMNISIVMLLATSMSDVKLTVSIFGFRINYSFYLWYLFLLSIFHHHFVPSLITVWREGAACENKSTMHKKLNTTSVKSTENEEANSSQHALLQDEEHCVNQW